MCSHQTSSESRDTQELYSICAETPCLSCRMRSGRADATMQIPHPADMIEGAPRRAAFAHIVTTLVA